MLTIAVTPVRQGQLIFLMLVETYQILCWQLQQRSDINKDSHLGISYACHICHPNTLCWFCTAAVCWGPVKDTESRQHDEMQIQQKSSLWETHLDCLRDTDRDLFHPESSLASDVWPVTLTKHFDTCLEMILAGIWLESLEHHSCKYVDLVNTAK